MPCSSIPRRCALLEEYFPCILRIALTLFFLLYLGTLTEKFSYAPPEGSGGGGGGCLSTPIKNTIRVGLIIPREGRAPFRRTTIMVVNVQGEYGEDSSVEVSAVGDKTSRSADEVVFRFGLALLQS